MTSGDRGRRPVSGSLRAPHGVILAGGQARRMGGGDKGRLMLGDRTILSHVLDRFAPQVPQIALSANGDPARFADLNLAVIPDDLPGFPGPLAGVLAGLDWAEREGADRIVTVAADTPFLPGDLVPRLLLAAETEGRPIALAATPDPEGGMRRHPTFGLWPVVLRHDLRTALTDGLRRVGEWAARHGAATACFATERGDPFLNVNTPEDLERARAVPGS